MKISLPKHLWLALCLMLSCKEEPININCADPLGTDTKTLKDGVFSCFQEEFNSCVWFHLDVNPPVLQSVIVVKGNAVAYIFDVGEVECLSKVTIKPSSGWVYVTTAKLHHGYVIKMEDGTYGRLYIDSWEISGSLVSEVNIKRQYAY